jgi:type IV pilus assembly protein PilA
MVMLAGSGCNLWKGLPRDHECRSALRTIMGLEDAFSSERQRYSTHPAEVGFVPSQGNRYLYLFAAQGELTRRDGLPSPPLTEAVGYGPDTRKRGVLLEDLLLPLPAELRASAGISGQCPDCSMTVLCVGNLDDDPDLDVWSISTKDRPDGVRGTPIHHLKDL